MESLGIEYGERHIYRPQVEGGNDEEEKIHEHVAYILESLAAPTAATYELENNPYEADAEIKHA